MTTSFSVVESEPADPVVRSVELTVDVPGLKVVTVHLAGPGYCFNTSGTTMQLFGKGRDRWAEVTATFPEPPEPGQPATLLKQAWRCAAGSQGGDAVYKVFIPVAAE